MLASNFVLKFPEKLISHNFCPHCNASCGTFQLSVNSINSFFVHYMLEEGPLSFILRFFLLLCILKTFSDGLVIFFPYCYLADRQQWWLSPAVATAASSTALPRHTVIKGTSVFHNFSDVNLEYLINRFYVKWRSI